jgi:hypothetical protein
MDWYCALTEHLDKSNIEIGDESFESILRQLEEEVIALYKALLQYQMKSVCSYYYRNLALVFLRGLANLDDWDGDLKSVTDAEETLQKDLDRYNSQHMKSTLGQLVKRAEGREKLLGDIRQDVRDFIALQKEMQRDDKDAKCLQDLFVVDPQYDMDNIEKEKDILLDDAYKWILDTKEYVAFTNWGNHESVLPPYQLLWVKGHAGTGKTMLLIGIIRELSNRPAALTANVSHFFCQGTNKTRNSATAALRSLVWLLLVQQPHLITHLRRKHDVSGYSLFTDSNAFLALSDAFKSMLKDPRLSPVYLIVDALDECGQGLEDLVQLISTSLTLSDKVKWLVSSRPEVKLKNPDTAEALVELDAQSLERPVNAYINHKLTTMTERPGYDEDTLVELSNEIHQRAMNTFLWVALVFKELVTVDGWDAIDAVKKIPPGLSELYDHIMTRIEHEREIDQQRCKNVLVALSLAYRPLSLSELAVLASLEPKIKPERIVEKCRSFLTTGENTVNLIHQSAKDYLEVNFKSKIQPAGVARGHLDISRRSIDAMSSMLVKNIYALPLGYKPKDIRPPDPDPLAPIRYSCIFWADHLCSLNGENPECKRELMDDGRVFRFLKKRFLRWLESLSLLGNLSDGVWSMRRLLHIARVLSMAL